ncbi:winged helix-turn-helix domain-containing tetratricopeptide repeat protein [Bradyrhizobium sp. CIAT3101]|uniref:winged helix-turn-helix domain-containing tetratricopeptide repeat protein n=1 Tax=Bradyrhizobium sp. CIAT3101 TaxID=439387 RepID=UPI0024B155F2|nr:winged helix-turn-helix domain-containing tetratricopeptide repeat protein [Bradyrhizobium sp. CIAT3101]WFU78333.1 winged helix-turn-helix domain-containing tetratricopeptide repeat protein [Bradyrhizobium sp. CIAT3101]
MRYLFEDYALDTDRRELHRATDAIVVAPQVFDLLEYLIRNRERVVSKDDLLNAVWNGRIVSDAALTTRLNAARSAIGDTGEKQRLIKTLPRKGFRFIGAVHQDDGRTVLPSGSTAGGVVTPNHTLTPRLSIVVLPFVNIGGDREQDYFIDGVTESLTTDLSRINGAFVIAHSTSLKFKGKAVDVTKLGRELNVRYVLEGAVQRGGNRLRINVQLIDAETRAHLWADRFDKPMTDLLEMQDEIVARLANALDAQLIEAEARRAERSPHPDAVDLCFQGRHSLNKGRTPENMAEARCFFERASALEPENVEALVGKAEIALTTATAFMADDRDAHLAAAEAALLKVLSMAPRHARAHMSFGWMQLFTRRAVEAIGEFERALALDRNLATAHALTGFAKVFIGRGAESEAHIQQAFRLSPRDSSAYRWMHWLGVVKLILGAEAEAVDWLRRCLEANRNYPIVHFQLAAALALVGSLDEARAAVRAGLALDPGFDIGRTRGLMLSRDPTFRAGSSRIRDGMLMAGVPER